MEGEVTLTKNDWSDLLKQAEAMLKKAMIDVHQFTRLRQLSLDKLKEFEVKKLEVKI